MYRKVHSVPWFTLVVGEGRFGALGPYSGNYNNCIFVYQSFWSLRTFFGHYTFTIHGEAISHSLSPALENIQKRICSKLWSSETLLDSLSIPTLSNGPVLFWVEHKAGWWRGGRGSCF